MRPKLRIVLKILQEVLIIFIILNILLILLLLLLLPQLTWLGFLLGLLHLLVLFVILVGEWVVNTLILCLFLLEMVQLPEPSLLPLAELWESLLDDDDIWEVDVALLVLVEFADLIPVKVICQDCIIKVKNLTKVSVHTVCLIIDSKVLLSGQLDLHLAETLLDGGSARIKVVVDVLDVEHNELRQSIPAEH